MKVSGQLHAPAASPLLKSHRCSLDRKMDEPRSQSDPCGEESLVPNGNRILARSVRSKLNRNDMANGNEMELYIYVSMK
jgi:hypothetical protein